MQKDLLMSMQTYQAQVLKKAVDLNRLLGKVPTTEGALTPKDLIIDPRRAKQILADQHKRMSDASNTQVHEIAKEKRLNTQVSKRQQTRRLTRPLVPYGRS